MILPSVLEVDDFHDFRPELAHRVVAARLSQLKVQIYLYHLTWVMSFNRINSLSGGNISGRWAADELGSIFCTLKVGQKAAISAFCSPGLDPLPPHSIYLRQVCGQTIIMSEKSHGNYNAKRIKIPIEMD